MDCLAVVEYLREKLQSENAQVILVRRYWICYLANFSIIDEFFIFFVQRTLFVIEALLRSDVPDIYSHFDLALEELNSLTSSENSSVKAKATKVTQ